MANIVEVAGLSSVLQEQGISYADRDFEEIYSDLCADASNGYLVDVIKNRVREYFSRLELPPCPTLYDHLVLSLREKDLIATFNWDPLLYRACWRNHQRARLPHVVYLHGSVALGYCLEDGVKGWKESKCSKCGKTFTPSELLYPIKSKNYSRDPFLGNEWEALRHALSRAYMLTIFGYGAPQSDVEAIELMKGAWGDKNQRDLEQIEIIDVKGNDDLRDTWGDFIHTHHYDVHADFYDSSIGLFPRRTCEAEWNYTMPEKPAFYPQNPIPTKLAFKELWEWYGPLTEAEDLSHSR